MAADSLRACAYISQEPARKIHVIRGELIGLAGAVSDVNQFIEWYKDGAAPEYYPIIPDCVALVVGPYRGRIVCKRFEGPYPSITRKFCAVGSGAEFAMGAMVLGHSAKEAVRAAAKLDMNTGGPIRAKRLKL